MIQPLYREPAPRIRNPRTARTATEKRIVQKSRARYANIWRITGALIVVLGLLMGYVVLTSSLTGLSYAVASAKRDREALQADVMRLDDRVAALRSDDRLSAVAAKLGMRDPQRFALVTLRPPSDVANAKQRVPMLSSLAGFFAPVATGQR